MSAELEVLQDAMVALSYYAEPRMTRDVDLVVELAGMEPRSIVALFAADYYIVELDVARAIAARTMFNV